MDDLSRRIRDLVNDYSIVNVLLALRKECNSIGEQLNQLNADIAGAHWFKVGRMIEDVRIRVNRL